MKFYFEFICYNTIKGEDYMITETYIKSNIKNYIKSNKKLKNLDFLTVYIIIVELTKDGKTRFDTNV